MKTLPLGLLVPLIAFAAYPARAQEDLPLTRLFDTTNSSTEPLTEQALAPRSGWREVAENDVDHRFSGDAALLNDKLVVILRKQGHGPEVYAKTAGGLRQRATLGQAPTVSAAIAALNGFKIIENTSGGVVVEAAFKSTEPAGLRFRLTAGEPIVEIQTGETGGFVDVQAQTRYVVVPDYFGDDVVYGSEAFRGCCLPAENFCLSLLDGGDAMLMSVWQSGEQEAWLATTSPSGDGRLRSSRIRCLKDKSIWLAFMESPAIWHATRGPAGTDWKAPFPAKWRSSLVRANGLADSWDVELGRSVEQSAGKHEGPLVIYPIDRSIATPLTVTCPTDVMRNTLGTGPCQYILACEGLAAEGDPTPNSVMGWVEKLFEQKKETKAADDIQQRLDQMAKHIADARSRIEGYAAFAVRVRKLLPGKDGPYQSIIDDLEHFAAAGLTPGSSSEHARQLADEITHLVGKEDGFAQCQGLGRQLRSIGTVQDSTLAKCRMGVRRLRQQSKTLLAATQPSGAELSQDIQRLAEDMLRNK